MPDNSVITIRRRQLLCQITSGAISSIPPITHIAFGKGGTDAAGNPIQPSATATGLNDEIAQYPISSVSYPLTPPTTARYVVVIPDNDLPGASINEAALVDSSGGLHAIKTFFVKRKDGGVTFTFTFDDEF